MQGSENGLSLRTLQEHPYDTEIGDHFKRDFDDNLKNFGKYQILHAGGRKPINLRKINQLGLDFTYINLNIFESFLSLISYIILEERSLEENFREV